MAIGDYIPNVFGANPTMYQGLLGADEAANLTRQSNIAGLLGAAATLATGMGSQGPRRSALQNVLGALAAGYGTAGQAYGAGIEQMANAQKLAQMKIQMQQNLATQEAVAKLRQDPNLDEATRTALLVDPTGTIKNLSEIRQFQRLREQYAPKPISAVQPTEVTDIGAEKQLAPVVSTANPEISELERQIQNNLADAATFSAMRDPAKAEASTRIADRLRERQYQLMASDINIQERIDKAPEQFKGQYQAIERIKGSLKPEKLIDAIQKVDQAVLESGKQYKYDGIVGQYAYNTFGTNDATKLTSEQNKNILAFANAPTQADQTKIAIDAQKLKFETGTAPALPTSREAMLGGVQPAQPTAQPVAQPAQAPTIVPRGPIPPMAQPPAPRVAPEMQRTGEAAQPAAQPAVTKQPVLKPTTTPLINQPDKNVPPKRKQDILAAQPATISLVNYTITQLVDARDAAQALLSNPKQIKAISGLTGPAISKIPGTEAYDAAAKLENLQTRAFVTEIQRMRAASPTGGAVGNVTEREMAALSNIQASLKLGLKEGELRKQLKQYVDGLNRALKTIPKEYANTYGYQGEFDDILKGGVVQQPTQSGLPAGVTVKRK